MNSSVEYDPSAAIISLYVSSTLGIASIEIVLFIGQVGDLVILQYFGDIEAPISTSTAVGHVSASILTEVTSQVTLTLTLPKLT